MAPQEAGLVAGLIVLVLGLVIAVKPNWYIRFVRWQIREIWAGEFKATKNTENRMRTMGFLLFLMGAVILYTVYFFS